MKVLELLFTIIIFIGIIYTAIPCALSVYCFVILPHIHNDNVFLEDTTVTGVETVVEIDIHQSPPIYTDITHQPKTIAQLQTALQVCNPPQPHSESFDCSELSAYTEYYLENNGFNTTISASFAQGHAWCTVYNIVGYDIVHVECIPPAHISATLPPVELSYNNITEALAGDYPEEFDWWSN